MNFAKKSHFVIMLLVALVFQTSVNAQEKAYGDFRDSLNYVSDLNKQHDWIVKYLATLKQTDVLAERKKFRHVFFKDPTISEPRLVISFDTIKSNRFVKRSKRYYGNKDLIFENKRFNYPVILAGLTYEGRVIFRNCIFMDFILIGGTFKKQIVFERNAFVGRFQLGQDKIVAQLDSGASFKQNAFLKEASISNMESKEMFTLDNNFFDYGLATKDVIFRKAIWGRNNLFQNELKLLQTDCYDNVDLRVSVFLNGLSLSRSTFNNVILSGSTMTRSMPHSLYRISNSKISHGLICESCKIDSLTIISTDFGRDSSYADFSNAKIKKLIFLPGARPYLLDLSNAIIDRTGYIDIVKLGDTLRSKTGTGKTKVPLGQKTILYADNIDWDRVKLDYKSLEAASIAYDPNTHLLTEKVVFDGLEMKGMESMIGKGKIVTSSEFDEIVGGGFYPPYSDSLWRKKNFEGLAAKETLYKKLIAKFEKEDDHRGLEKADMEYRHFLLIERDPTFMNKVSYYANLWWWEFGYARNRIVLWTLFFFAFFSLLNKPFLKFLVTEIYVVDNIVSAVRIVNERTEPNPIAEPYVIEGRGRSTLMRFRSWIDRILRRIIYLTRQIIASVAKHLSLIILSFIYTGFIFFGIKMDADKFVHKKNAGTLWVVLVYTIGLICTAFLVNLIIGR